MKHERLRFVLLMWLLSRGIIILAMVGIAPLLPMPSGGMKAEINWNIFSAWDSSFYQQIAIAGYEPLNHTFGADVAFFPLFPLTIHLLTLLGIPVKLAGIALNNLAFLAALMVLSRWVEDRHGKSAAQWSTAILAWCPYSLFGTVIYTEGLFLLFSTAALQAFDRKNYRGVVGWGSLATATRVMGLALIPAFLSVAWREKRPLRAYLASLASALGIVGYSLYCWLHFDNPFAFLLVQQRDWQPQQAFWGQGWLRMLVEIFLGPANWHDGTLVMKDISYPLAMMLLGGLGYYLWRSQQKWGTTKIGCGFCVLLVLFWLLAGNPLLNMGMVLGGAYVLWYARHQISPVALLYGLFSLGIILSSGRTTSAERYIYAIVSIAIAFGLLLSRYPRWGYLTLVFFAFLLASFSVRFAQHLWVG